jgi:hypothetical protein
MLPDAALPVPASLMTLLAVFSPLFTAPSFGAIRLAWEDAEDLAA